MLVFLGALGSGVSLEILNGVVMLKRSWYVMLAAVFALALAMVPGTAQANGSHVYSQPGQHHVNDRYWQTECDMYSTNVVRCQTEIWATKVISHGGRYYNHNGFVFNNMTYLPSPRAAWDGNPLAGYDPASGTMKRGEMVEWTGEDGRRWATECDTATTGRGGCRAYNIATRVQQINGSFVKTNDWVLNNILQFSSAAAPHITQIPARSADVAGFPVEKDFVPPPASSFRADPRCMTGRALCISKNQRKMAWMKNGQIIKTFDVRFGAEGTRLATREGQFSVLWKSRNHVSSIYNTAMPYAMFFSGGQAVHYSSDFANRGYNGSSAGCVNVRDYEGIKWLFDTEVNNGDKVIVYR